MVVPLVNALDSLDASLVEAGYDLGGSGWTVLRRIVIPHAMPGIVAGCIVVFMLTVGNFVTPMLLGGKNSLWFTEQIYAQFITRFNWPQGAAFGFLLLVLSSAIVWAGLKPSRPALRRRCGTHDPVAAALAPFALATSLRRGVLRVPVRAARWSWPSSRSTTRLPAPPWRGFTLEWFVGGAVAHRALRRPRCWRASARASWSRWVTLLSVAVGTANAFLLERAQFRGKTALSLMMLSPLVIPGVILGISILAFSSRSRSSPTIAWGIELDFLRPGLALVVLGQFSFILPIATLIIAARLKRFDGTLEEAAFDLGAARARCCGPSPCPTCGRR